MDFFFTSFWSHWFLLHPSVIHDEYWLLKQNTGCSVIYTYQIFQFIISILKSPANPGIWLVQIVWFEYESHYFQSESHLFVSKTKFNTTFRWPIILQHCIQFANQIRENNVHKMKYFSNFISYVWHCYYSLKWTKWCFIYINPENVQCHTISVWYQTFNFISHSYYAIMWFNLFTRVWYQIKLHSTQFSDHYFFV